MFFAIFDDGSGEGLAADFTEHVLKGVEIPLFLGAEFGEFHCDPLLEAGEVDVFGAAHAVARGHQQVAFPFGLVAHSAYLLFLFPAAARLQQIQVHDLLFFDVGFRWFEHYFIEFEEHAAHFKLLPLSDGKSLLLERFDNQEGQLVLDTFEVSVYGLGGNLLSGNGLEMKFIGFIVEFDSAHKSIVLDVGVGNLKE
jgi:hypothetical protein